MKRHDIALAPDSMDGRIATRGGEADRLAIDSRRGVFCPSRNPQLQVESPRRFRVNLDPDVAGPGVVACFPEF